MPYQKLMVTPGVRSDLTPLLNESGWSSCSLIRFFHGILQKLGGWTRLLSTAVVGTARAMVFFEDADNNQYLGIGTEQRLEVYTAGALYDVTPVTATDNLTNPFSTTATSTTVTITDATTNPTASEWINIVNPASVGGVVLNGLYLVQTVPSGTTYTITIPTAATGTVSGGGTAALFTTIMGNASVTVTLNNHGYIVGNQYTIYISTTVGGFTLFGVYTVATVVDANNFTIIPGGTASSSTSAHENSGNIRIEYLLTSGNVSNMNVPGLYGSGPYGGGPYGSGSILAGIPARLWSLGQWGTDMVATYTNGSIYAWLSENGLINNPATIISQAPVNINAGMFIAMPEQQIVALGASDGSGSNTDQLLVRWCDIADYTDWTASATNQAGSYRIPRGAEIVGGMQGPQQGLIWTDIGLWAMQYIGFPLVYGFNELGEGCGLIGQNARGVLGGRVYWMSFHGFFVYDGNSVQRLPCPVWDIIFGNLNMAQASKIIGAPNSYFGEISFFYPSASGSGENDSYVKFNDIDGVWDYGSLVRTAWIDQTSGLSPLGIDGSGLIQQHEVGNDADGVAMDSWGQTGWFKISDGTIYTFLERIIPDFIYQNATLQITLFFADYPWQTPTQIGPLTATQATKYLIVRGRGRLVSIKFESDDLGSFWRLGQMLYAGGSSGGR